MLNHRVRDNANTLTLLMPWIIVLAVFWLYPLFYAIYISLTDYKTLTNTATFVGLANYENLFGDSVFWVALQNTAIFTLGTVPVTTAIALILASILNNKLIRFKEFFRASYFLPTVTSLVVISLIFTNLYARDGYINNILSMFGMPFPERGWLLDTSTALLSIMAMDVWISIGYYMILFLAGMQTISEDLYDSAKLNGASPVQQFFYITLPLIKPTLLFVLVINTIKSFQVFIEIFVMTKGGPLDSTTTLVYLVFVNAFEKTDMMGYASAIAFVLFFILLVFSYLQIKFLKVRD
ncbi:MAG: sugar ABC transporter permease [Ignavibacteriae bacterium HGW-Ignavibacteriae-1]|jgi:multiple sugar transport system permease protein|nr:MAG: sugar ABC transporter permease [Ignavibacteriae bacterium HGW-Ignavibacteriae-1]